MVLRLRRRAAWLSWRMHKRRFACALLVAFALCGSGALSPVAGRAWRSVENAGPGRLRGGELMLSKLPDVKIPGAPPPPAATAGPVRAPPCRVAGIVGAE